MSLDPNIPSEVYPFATIDGRDIPLDIIKPLGLIFTLFTPAFSSLAIPGNKGVAIFYATEDCIIHFLETAGEFNEGEYKETALFLPKNHAISSTIIEGTAFVAGLEESGRLMIQLIEKWAGLSTEINYVNR